MTSGAFGVKQVVGALKEAGVRSGDLVNVYSRLFSLGLPDGAPHVSEIPALYLKALQEVVGPFGTLVVPTYTTSFGRFGKPFILEESPSEMGKFSEHVRTSPGSRRSLHPIHSVVALGPLARELVENHPRWNVGHDTIWERMLRRGGRVVTLGLRPRQCMTQVHHIEAMACVPYVYHKVLRGEVWADGRQVVGDFFMSVRYLEYDIAWDLTRLEKALLQRGELKRVPLGEDAVWSVPMEAVFSACLEGLRQDIYYLLEKPPAFVEGRIPTEGISAQRETAPPAGYFEILE